jgi:putative MFS transporter
MRSGQRRPSSRCIRSHRSRSWNGSTKPENKAGGNDECGGVAIGFCLLLSIYVLVALPYGVYTPELFPTEVRLRANGFCNMLGRGATIVSPFIVLGLFKAYGIVGVTSLMIGLLIQIVAVMA